jgi:hypothetical protein
MPNFNPENSPLNPGEVRNQPSPSPEQPERTRGLAEIARSAGRAIKEKAGNIWKRFNGWVEGMEAGEDGFEEQPRWNEAGDAFETVSEVAAWEQAIASRQLEKVSGLPISSEELSREELPFRLSDHKDVVFVPEAVKDLDGKFGNHLASMREVLLNSRLAEKERVDAVSENFSLAKEAVGQMHETGLNSKDMASQYHSQKSSGRLAFAGRLVEGARATADGQPINKELGRKIYKLPKVPEIMTQITEGLPKKPGLAGEKIKFERLSILLETEFIPAMADFITASTNADADPSKTYHWLQEGMVSSVELIENMIQASNASSTPEQSAKLRVQIGELKELWNYIKTIAQKAFGE